MFQDSTWYAHFNDDHKLNKEQQTMQEELWSSESLHIKKKQTNITRVFTFSRPKLKIAPELLTKFPLGKLWLHLTLLNGFPYAFGSK